MGPDATDQMPAGRLHIALLVGAGYIDRPRLGLQMTAELLVGVVERTLLIVAFDPVGRRRRVVGPQFRGHSAQAPVARLNPGLERNERFGKANARPLPIAAGQHEVTEQMIEGSPLDGDAKFPGPLPVELRRPAGLMRLRKEHFLGRTVEGPPHLYSALKRAQRDRPRQLRLRDLQVRQQPLRFDLRCRLQIARGFRHDVFQRIRPGPVRPRPLLLFVFIGARVRLQVARRRLRMHVRPQGRVADHAAVFLVFFHESYVLSRGDHEVCEKAPSVTAAQTDSDLKSGHGGHGI